MTTLTHRIAAVAATLGIAAGLALLPAAAASAAGPNDFTPSPNKPRAYILNILGRMLGPITPNSWRAEQIANQYQYNHSWEMQAAQLGYSTKWGSPTYPDSYEDYVLMDHEREFGGGKNNRPMTAPATRAQTLVKGVAGATVAYTGFQIGTSVGNGALSLFGFDTSGVCAYDDVVGGFLATINGIDCDAMRMSDAAQAAANSDAVPGLLTDWACSSVDSSRCIRVVGLILSATPLVVFEYQGSIPSSYFVLSPSGVWSSITGFTSCAMTGSSLASGCRNAGYAPASHFVNRASVSGWADSATRPVGIAFDVTGQGVYQPVVEASGDPERWLTCSILGDDGNTYTAQSAAYTESSGEVATPECPALPEGVRPEHVGVEMDGNGVDPQTVYDEDVTDEYAAWWDAYPECRTGACKLDLIDVQQHASCFDLADSDTTACKDWFEDPDRDTNYECWYGSHQVDLDECFVYSGIFDQARIAVGAPYSDPMTGNWSGGANAPTPDAQALAQAVQDPTAPRACTGMATETFDPVALVMRPVQCALEWAFVPRPTVVALAGEQVAEEFDTRAPGQLAAMVSGWQITPQMDGCKIQAPYSPLPGADSITITVVDACEGSVMAPIAAISRIVTGVGFAVLIVVLVRRQVSGTVDYRGH